MLELHLHTQVQVEYRVEKRGNTKIPTGSSEYTKANNIYDLAGNVHEGTLESATDCNRWGRGGDYSDTNNGLTAQVRNYVNSIRGYPNRGTRAFFYIK